MGIRSKLVWFQNETEEKKILEYVISSCNKAASDISSMIASRQTSLVIPEPENEVSSASLYVPPYPPLKELKPVDGFYRDRSGKPVIVFSMLQINSGPLMDYFAPFDHRLESYTVGGGSRYNIENSPVYEAFHKYPGTHRVGWDGWCGHLIKDRWPWAVKGRCGNMSREPSNPPGYKGIYENPLPRVEGQSASALQYNGL